MGVTSLNPMVCANTIIFYSLREKISLSPMKLQKLLYLLYARYLALFSVALFPDNFERWQYGPVVSSVYMEFCEFGPDPIDRFIRNSAGDVEIVDESDSDFYRCFYDVWSRFKNNTGIELSILTHQTHTAWANVPDGQLFLDCAQIKEDGRVLFAN